MFHLKIDIFRSKICKLLYALEINLNPIKLNNFIDFLLILWKIFKYINFEIKNNLFINLKKKNF